METIYEDAEDVYSTESSEFEVITDDGFDEENKILNCYFYSIIGEQLPSMEALMELQHLTGWDSNDIYSWIKNKTDHFVKFQITPYYAEEAIKFRPAVIDFQAHLPHNSHLRVNDMPRIFDTIDKIAMQNQKLPTYEKEPDILNCYFYSVCNEHFITMNAAQDLALLTGLNRSQVLEFFRQKLEKFLKYPIPQKYIDEAKIYKAKAQLFQDSLPLKSGLRVPFVPTFDLSNEAPDINIFSTLHLETSDIFNYYFYAMINKDNDTQREAVAELSEITGLSKAQINEWIIYKSSKYMQDPKFHDAEAYKYTSMPDHPELPPHSVLRLPFMARSRPLAALPINHRVVYHSFFLDNDIL